MNTTRPAAALGALAVLLAALLGPVSPARAQGDSGGSYRIQPLDLVKVSVYDEPDLAADQRVAKDGTIAMPLLGTVRIAGLTARQAEQLLEQRFVGDRYLRTPKVNLIIEEYGKRQVSVLGQVTKPGVVEFGPEQESMDILEAIAQREGFTNIAKKNDVIVTRNKGAANEQIFKVDCSKLLRSTRGDGGSAGFRLLPGDVVFVKERLF